MYRKKTLLDESVEIMWELTGYFWQAGVVVVFLFLFLTFKAYGFVASLIESLHSMPMFSEVAKYGFVLYLLPLMLLILSVMFAVKFIETWEHSRQ